MPNVVSNTGPILALANVEQFDLLRQFYGKVFIPPAVRAEVKDDVSLAAITSVNWITITHRSHTAFVGTTP
jgi:predicted nucleic acid-binding protein